MSTQTINSFIEGQAGPSFLADGSVSSRMRFGKTGELITGLGVGQHYEQSSRGKVYFASNQSVVTFGTGLTATGVTFHLWNPPGSQFNLEVKKCSVTILTGGTGGHLVYAMNWQAGAVVAGTALAVNNMYGASGVGLAKSATTLPAAPVAIMPLGAVITAAGTNNITDYLDGIITVVPGAVLSVQGITVVGTGLIGMAWAEVPISA